MDRNPDREELDRYWRIRRRGGKRYPCPTCGRPDRLTAWERAQGYQCDACANRDEGKGPR